MSEITPILEDIRRQVTAGPGAFEGVARRKGRRRRNQRLVTAVFALILAAAAIGAAIRVIGEGRQIPANHGITSENVKHLTLAWSAGGFDAGTPVVGDRAVFVGSQEVDTASGSGELRAYPTNCSDPCQPLWVAPTGAGTDLDTPALSDGVLFVANSGPLHPWGPPTGTNLFAFPTDCGNPCDPSWVADIGGVANPNLSPVVADGVVYVPSATGLLYAFSTACGTKGATCRPLWTASLDGNAGQAITISGQTVYVSTGGPGLHPGELFAFSTTCRKDCRPEWKVTTERTVWDLADAGDRLILAMAGAVQAYSHDCLGADACKPLWTLKTRGGLLRSTPASAVTVTGDTVFINARGGLYALPLDCGHRDARCIGGWSTGGFGETGSARPAVAGDVVYLGLNLGGLRAFPANCAETPFITPRDDCLPPVWEGQIGPLVHDFVSITATSDAVYAGASGSSSRGLHVFRLGNPTQGFGNAESISPSSGTSTVATAFLYCVVAVIALLLLVRGRRRAI